MPAPISLFTYNRPEETRQTIEALQKNYLAIESDLFIFSDGPKNECDFLKIQELRSYLASIQGFKTVRVIESKTNKGLANSIIEGVNFVFEKYDNIIVLEDDLVSKPNFLDFINQSLDFYACNDKIFSVSGYSMDLYSLKSITKDYYLGYRASSWGWGTWKNRWQDIDWCAADYKSVLWHPAKHIKFMRGGSDMPYMLNKQMKGQIDSWAIRWCYHQFKNDQLTVFPSKSKIMSIGFGESATHTKKTKRFFTSLDEGIQRDFQFDHQLELNETLVKEFKLKFSIFQRIKDRIIFS